MNKREIARLKSKFSKAIDLLEEVEQAVNKMEAE